MTQRTGAAALARRVATGATAVLAAGTLLTGCTGKDGESAAPSPSPDPKTTLLAAVPDEKDPAFRFTGIDATGTVTGAVDPAGKGWELVQKDAKAGFTTTTSRRVIDQRFWMKVDFSDAGELSDLLKLPEGWMEFDQSKLEEPEVYQGADVGNTAVIIRAADAVRQQADGSYTGTVDLTGGPEVADAVDGVDVAVLADTAKAIPFTAVIGPDGNLASLTLDIPAAGQQKALEYVVKYHDFGTVPGIAAPTGADVEAAPASAYELLNG
ncbi:hypothetical protein QTQ03_15445 [Micromonospora sp. WMMA1363]|uniref:hypothetical protein n=1 Tax=Micromonospora sp. WMMA1363 TaxID=3053985 RepID=UPI00259D2CBD|nr:hypothetical protein [Micromonospora sp. WMMA1363]MDM4720918.1 hypothetical protein [Micromonospora sp. WMMA1363]